MAKSRKKGSASRTRISPAKARTATSIAKKAAPKAKALVADAVPATGTCTVTAAGVTAIRRHYTKQACIAWASAIGGTYQFVPD